MPRDPSTSLRSAQDDRIELLDDLERRSLAVARSGTGKQRADRLNGLAVATDDPANIALPHLESKNGNLSPGYFGEHDLVGKLNELTNDELEELLHKVTISRRCEVVDHRLRRTIAVILAGLKELFSTPSSH